MCAWKRTVGGRNEWRMVNRERYYRGIARILEWAGAMTNSTRLLLASFDHR